MNENENGDDNHNHSTVYMFFKSRSKCSRFMCEYRCDTDDVIYDDDDDDDDDG